MRVGEEHEQSTVSGMDNEPQKAFTQLVVEELKAMLSGIEREPM